MSGIGRGGVVPSSRLEELLRGSLPLVALLLFMAIDLAPLPSAAPTTIAPLLSLAAIFFWTVHRPDLLGPGFVLIAALILDAAAGLPLGLTALALFLTRLTLQAPPRFLVGRSFLVIWAWFSLAVVLLLTIRWLLASIFFQHLFAFHPVVFEILLTVAAYPPVSLVLERVQPSLPKMHHAAPRS
jgi:rod shape-determining protein MreD